MIIDKEDWEELKNFIDNMFFFDNHLTSDGRCFLKLSSELINKIENKQINKIYTVSFHSVIDDETRDGVIGVTTSFKDAQRILKKEARRIKKEIGFVCLDNENIDDEWLDESDRNSYCLYLKGNFISNNILISIKETEILNNLSKSNKKKKRRESDGAVL